MTENLVFQNAKEEDAKEVLSLYKSLLGTEGCAWDEDYPGAEQITFDLQRNALYVLKNDAGRIVATISVDDDPFVKNLECWTMPGGIEISRLGVANDYRNKGIARLMIDNVCEVLKSRGAKAVRYLVCKDNAPALNSYRKLSFTKVGECRLFDEDFFCYEKSLV